ncbi:ABC transporter ATP-binding protein [Gracilibacillus salinarum]|nr:ABC transporter ATP-binding protein [Gracilibacillus salinarum]
MSVNRLMTYLTPAIMLILNFSILVIVWVGSSLISNGNLQVGQLMAFIQYAIQIMFSVVMASVALTAYPRASVSASRMMEVLDIKPGSAQPINKHIRKQIKGKSLQLNDVSFYYPGAEQPALSNINMTIKPNRINAIVGGTGCGKSTLLQLLLKFYKPTSGSIHAGSVPLEDFKEADWRNAVGYVPQKNHLFTGTMEENIRLGNVTATNEELLNAIEDANLRPLIESFSNKHHTNLKPKAANMSGGQKQRVALARAFISNAPILMFDDSLSALDFKTSEYVQASFRKNTNVSTIIVASQDIHAVSYADHIVILDKGKVVASGSYQQLTADDSFRVKEG